MRHELVDAMRAKLAAYHRLEASARPGGLPLPRTAPEPDTTAHRAPPHAGVAQEIDALVARLERWESTNEDLLGLDTFDALVTTLELLAAPDRQFVLATHNRRELGARLSAVLGPAHLEHLDNDTLDELADALHCSFAKPPGELDWQRDHLLARLEAAARTHSTVVLDLGDRTCTVAVSRVTQRGATMVVLGEDEDDRGIAIRVTDIGAIAEPAPSPERSGRWKPAPGMKAPAGHVACPCNSGRRYRDCCRSHASA